MTKRFSVIEGANAYYLYDNELERSACLGDGVDRYDAWYEDCGGPPPAEIGTEEFRAAWEAEANEYADEFLEAYFGDQTEGD